MFGKSGINETRSGFYIPAFVRGCLGSHVLHGGADPELRLVEGHARSLPSALVPVCSSALSDSCRLLCALKLVLVKSGNVSKSSFTETPNAPTHSEGGPYVGRTRPLASSRDTLHDFSARHGN